MCFQLSLCQLESVMMFWLYFTITLIGVTRGEDKMTKELDKVIEQDITSKLVEDLIESVEMKFHDALSKSVNMVLVKVSSLLHNGSNHIQERLEKLQKNLENVRNNHENELCLKKLENQTQSLAENALHQMIMCAYALIGQDPSHSILKVMEIKKIITDSMKPILLQKAELYELMKICGHDHDSLKKVVKCVISESPVIKSVMMETTEKIIGGVVDMTKMIAHGAMHEACLIEVVKSIEDQALKAIEDMKCNKNSIETV